MLGGGNIVELLGLNKVKKGSTAKPTFPPPDFFREYFFKKSGGTGPRHPDFLEKYSENIVFHDFLIKFHRRCMI